jgi:DnaK suppressor protein
VESSELSFFKDILKSRKEQILKNIDGVNNELSQLSLCELNDDGDHVSVNNDAMTESAIVGQQKHELKEIDEALGKIKSGEYGTCDMCGVDIGFQRLKVKPHAKYCIDCRQIIEKEK